MLAVILSGLLHQELLKTFVCKGNVIGSDSAHYLSKCSRRKAPQNLNEFRLIQCKILSGTLDDIMCTLASSHVRKLALVDININDGNLSHILKLVAESRYLVELDISWNSLSPGSLSRFLEVLSKNRSLKNLNLSGNNIQASNTKESQEMTEGDLQRWKSLGSFIKHNRSLQVLDLRNTQMTVQFLARLVPILRKAKSLLVLDVSGNCRLDETTR